MLSFSNTNNNEYLKKGEAKQTYVQKIIYNSDTTEIENDISNLETRMTTAEGNITTNTNNISTNTLNIGTNTSDISNLKTRMTTAEGRITTNTNNISTNTSDISNLKSRMTTAEGNITTNTNNISNLQTQINSIPINPYEGLFYFKYGTSLTNPIMIFNYDKGRMIFWENNDDNDGYMTSVNNADTDYCIYSTTTNLILPGN